MSTDIISRCKDIKIVLSDVDGILTDGKLYYGERGECIKAFHALDGLAMKMLMSSGMYVGIVTARNSEITKTRMSEIGVEIIAQGAKDKLAVCKGILEKLNLGFESLAYIGDDIPDLAVLECARLSATVPHALPYIKEQVDFITKSEAGLGAFREFAEVIINNKHE